MSEANANEPDSGSDVPDGPDSAPNGEPSDGPAPESGGPAPSDPAPAGEPALDDGLVGSDGADADVVDADVAEAGLAEPAAELSVEALVADLERVTGEREQYLEASRRIQAEFENYRKQVSKREVEARERANEGLIGEILPVLDAFDGALTNGVEEVLPMRTNLLDTLAKQGLERIDPSDSPFDPNQHEAVMHDDGDGDESGPVVAEVMRAGYLWKGRVIRPAMVRVRG